MTDIAGLEMVAKHYVIAQTVRLDSATGQFVEVPGLYECVCKTCGQGYAARQHADGTFQPGTIIALCDHALAHKEKGNKQE
jgi:hypothetical protein